MEKDPQKIWAPPQESVLAVAGQLVPVASQSFNMVLPLAPVDGSGQCCGLAKAVAGESPHFHASDVDYESEFHY